MRRNARVNDRRSLEIDPRPRSIEGKSAIRVEFRKGTVANPSAERWPTLAGPALEYLGEPRTDPVGR